MSGTRRARRIAALIAIVVGAGLSLLSPAASASAAASCIPQTGTYQRQVEAFLKLPVDGKASLADCIAVQKFQTRYDVRPNAGYAGPLTYSIVTRLATAHYADCKAPKSGRKVCVDLSSQVMWVLEGTKRIHGPTPIRTGRKGLATPAGNFTIGEKKVDGFSTIFKVPLPYWQRIYKDMGFHETTTYLYDSRIPGSHGCTNLLPADAKQLFALTTAKKTPVQVFGRKPGT